jgi:uncharacterized BrkB/YihY/UPF0761 family membrane protein
MMSDDSTSIDPEAMKGEPTSILRPKDRIGALTLVIAAVFGLLFAYFVWQAVRLLTLLPKSFETNNLGDSVPWALYIVGLAVPVLLYAVSFVVALRFGSLKKIVVYTMGLTTTAAFSFGVLAIHRLIFETLIMAIPVN